MPVETLLVLGYTLVFFLGEMRGLGRR